MPILFLFRQHRIGMMKILSEKKTEGIDLERVLVEVYPEQQTGDSNNKEEETSEYASEIFAEINKAEPVKSVDIFANKGDRKILVGGVEALKERYPAMFSPSLRCRPPNVNVDNLRDGIFAGNVLKDKGIKSPRALYEWLLEQNEKLAQIYTHPKQDFPVKVNEKALNKANKHGFYLGIDPTYGWISRGDWWIEWTSRWIVQKKALARTNDLWNQSAHLHHAETRASGKFSVLKQLVLY